MLHTYHTKVRVNGGLMPVSIQARTPAEARSLLEAQYGPGSVTNIPAR